MRWIVSLCLLVLVLPVLAGGRESSDHLLEAQSWKGKHSDQLIAERGKPKKIKPDGEDGRVLVYRLR